MRLIFGYCVTFKLIRTAAFRAPPGRFTVHLCLLKWGCSQATPVRGQVQGNGAAKAKWRETTSINNFHLKRQSLSQPRTVNGRDSRTDRIKSHRLRFKSLPQLFTNFADITYSQARSAYNNQAVNMSKQWGRRNTGLPSQRQPFRLLYSSIHQY